MKVLSQPYGPLDKFIPESIPKCYGKDLDTGEWILFDSTWVDHKEVARYPFAPWKEYRRGPGKITSWEGMELHERIKTLWGHALRLRVEGNAEGNVGRQIMGMRARWLAQYPYDQERIRLIFDSAERDARAKTDAVYSEDPCAQKEGAIA